MKTLATTKKINKKAKGYPCCNCKTEGECADNGWCLYDPYNKKCPNWKDGVKQWHKFIKDYRKGRI